MLSSILTVRNLLIENGLINIECPIKHQSQNKPVLAMKDFSLYLTSANVFYFNFLAPIFVFQWIHDTAQILADNKDLELDPKRIFSYKYRQYVKELGETLRTSLKDINSKQYVYTLLGVLSPPALTATRCPIAAQSSRQHF